MSQTFLEDIPEFLEIQRNSFLRVLDTGLIQALEKINPIVSTSQSECGLLFYPKEYVLVLPENTITEAFLQGKTYGCKIYVPAIIYEKEKKNISNSIDLKSWSCSALNSFSTSEALMQKTTRHTPATRRLLACGTQYSHQPPNISQNIEKQKKANRKVKALTKTLGSTLWPAISANAWPRTWPVSYKEKQTKDIKNNLFQGERGYGVLVGPKSKASKGIALVPRDHKALTSALQAKSSTTKQYFSSLFISIGCDDASIKKSLRIQNNSTWSFSEARTVGYKPSSPFLASCEIKREQFYSPNKNQNHLVLVQRTTLGAKDISAQKGQVLLGAKGFGFVPRTTKARSNTKTTTKNRGYFTFGLSFLSFGHFIRNLMCNSTLPKSFKTNTLKKNLRFFPQEGEMQQEKKNDHIPFGLSQNSAYLNKKNFLGYKVSLPSWSNLNHVYQEQAKNVVHAMDLQLGDKAASKSLQLLRSFERRDENPHTSLQLKDFLKRTNKHFINSSKGLTDALLPIRYTVLSQKGHGEQITKENPVTSLTCLQNIVQQACGPSASQDQDMEQVSLKNTLLISEKKIKPLSRKEWVCIGVLPLMTPRGHFIINGSHRIVVSQMGRAPGLYYQIGEKLQATIVPTKGAWLRMSVKENDNGEIKVWVRITPQRKIPYKIFIETYKYLENWKSPENPQFKFLNLTYKAINSKIKHFDKHYAIGVISGQIQRTLLNFASYNLGTLGRKRINERLSINEKKGYLTSKDISLIKRNLLKHLGQNPTVNFDDDIDHLQNRRVRTCGELLQSEIEVGMARLKKTASKQLEDYANSNLSIIEKKSFQLKPKPLNNHSEGSQRDLGQKPVHSNDLDNTVLNTSDTTVSKAHLAVLAPHSKHSKHSNHSIQSKQEENSAHFSYPVVTDFNPKTSEESKKSSVMLSQPLTIPGGYLNRGLDLKAHKNYGQGLKPLFLRRNHHQKTGSVILSSWFWSLQQEYRPLEQPRLLPLANSLSWRRSYRQIKDIGIYREKKYQNSTIPLQTQDLILVPLKKNLGLPFRVGVNLLSTRASTKALNSSWIVGRAAWQWRQGRLEAQQNPYDTKDSAVLRKHNQQSQHQEGVGGHFNGDGVGHACSAKHARSWCQKHQEWSFGPRPLRTNTKKDDLGPLSTKKSQTKPKALVKGHNGLWFSWQQSRLALQSTGIFGSKPQAQMRQVTDKGITTYQIKNEEQLNENLREVPKANINNKSRFSVDVSASGNTGGDRRQSRLALLSTGAPSLNLEKSKQKKWSPYKVISTKAFAGALREFFGSNPLSQYMDQTNPLAEITHKRRLSSLGPGGVDRASAGIAIRGIHPSHYGRICPIETPEGKNAGLVNSMTMWARVNEDGFLETPYLKVKGGSIMSHTNMLSPDWYFVPTKKETRAFPDVQLAGVSSTYSKAYLLPTSSSENQKHQKLNALDSWKNTCTTSQMIKIVTSDLNISESSFLPNISIPARDGAERSFERAKRAVVNFCGVSPTQNISVATSLIPFLEHDDATRALMGSNMQRQAVPLLKPQGPLVRTGLEGKVVGESGHALQANCSGVISIATRTFISIETFQTKNCSDPNFSLKESFSFLPQTYINANKSLSFLRKKGNYSDANVFDPNFGTMPPLLCTSSWGNSVGGISNLGGCDYTSKLPLPKSFSTQRGKELRFSAFKIQKTTKEKQKELQTTFYNYTFDPKEYTYETDFFVGNFVGHACLQSKAQHDSLDNKGEALLVSNKVATKKEPSAVLLGTKSCGQAVHAVHAVHAKHSMHSMHSMHSVHVPCLPCGASTSSTESKAGPKTKQAQSINFSRVTELINQYNFILVNINPNSSTSRSRDSLWFHNNGHVTGQTTKTLAFNTVYTYQKKDSNSCYASWPQRDKALKEPNPLGHQSRHQKALSVSHKNVWPTNVTSLSDSQGVLCHNMSKKFSRKSPLIERKTKTQKLQEYARSNQATICVQRPAVKTGDWVQKGDLIGDCSASVNGVLSLGKNIVVAYLPMEGFNFEDAIVVSDRLVHEELYTSIHVQRVEFDMDAAVKKYIPKKIKIKKQKAAYKTTGQDWITKHNPHLLQTEKELLNPLGIIKVGSWVGPGDVLVSKVVPVDRKIAPSRHLLLAVFQEKRTLTLDTDDTSLRVPKGIHGRVINVKVVGSGTVIPLDRNRFSVKKAISKKREKLLPFFKSGNKTKVNSLTGSEEPFWPLAKFAFALPLVKVALSGPSDRACSPCCASHAQHAQHDHLGPLGVNRTKTIDFSLQNHDLQGLNSTRPQKDRLLVEDDSQEVILASKGHKASTSAQQDPLKSKSFDPALKQLQLKASAVTISKTALRQDLLTRFPRVTQDLKKNHAAGILNILHQFKKRTNSIDLSIASHPRAFEVAKKVAFFPSFGIGHAVLAPHSKHSMHSMHGPSGLWDQNHLGPLGGDFSGQTKDLTDTCASLRASSGPKWSWSQGPLLVPLAPRPRPTPRTTAQQGIKKDGALLGLLCEASKASTPAMHAQQSMHAKKENLTDTGIIDLDLTKQNKGYSKYAENLSKSIIPALDKKKIDGEYKIIQVRIYIAERKKLQVGDKMSGRHGNKGIVSTILPREDMPFLPDGTSVDMVLNPLGIPSRMNVGQVFECLLGLASSVCGEIIGHTPFDEMYGPEASRSLVYLFLYLARLRSRTDWLFQPNFPGKTIVFDGRTGLPFEQWVTVGRAYMLKLIHMVDEKIHARSIGPRSLVTQQPVKGRARGGGQRLGEMELWALEGFGAAYTLQEILTLKSDDIRGRENVENSIIFSTTAKAHMPETFRMMLFELRCLCLNVELN